MRPSFFLGVFTFPPTLEHLFALIIEVSKTVWAPSRSDLGRGGPAGKIWCLGGGGGVYRAVGRGKSGVAVAGRLRHSGEG